MNVESNFFLITRTIGSNKERNSKAKGEKKLSNRLVPRLLFIVQKLCRWYEFFCILYCRSWYYRWCFGQFWLAIFKFYKLKFLFHLLINHSFYLKYLHGREGGGQQNIFIKHSLFNLRGDKIGKTNGARKNAGVVQQPPILLFRDHA
jgi:hypothetical protein